MDDRQLFLALVKDPLVGSRRPQANQPIDPVKFPVRADDGFAAGLERVRGVECIAGRKAEVYKQVPGAFHNSLVGDGKLEVESVQGSPASLPLFLPEGSQRYERSRVARV